MPPPPPGLDPLRVAIQGTSVDLSGAATAKDVKLTRKDPNDAGFLREALGRVGMTEPTEVHLGDETLDEMCLVGLLFAFERED